MTFANFVLLAFLVFFIVDGGIRVFSNRRRSMRRNGSQNMVETSDLHMYYIGEDYVVAASIDDAWTVWEEQTGSKRDDEDYECELVADDRVIGCQVDASGEPCEVGDPGSRTEKITAVEWARRLGRGFAFSENY